MNKPLVKYWETEATIRIEKENQEQQFYRAKKFVNVWIERGLIHDADSSIWIKRMLKDEANTIEKVKALQKKAAFKVGDLVWADGSKKKVLNIIFPVSKIYPLRPEMELLYMTKDWKEVKAKHRGNIFNSDTFKVIEKADVIEKTKNKPPIKNELARIKKTIKWHIEHGDIPESEREYWIEQMGLDWNKTVRHLSDLGETGRNNKSNMPEPAQEVATIDYNNIYCEDPQKTFAENKAANIRMPIKFGEQIYLEYKDPQSPHTIRANFKVYSLGYDKIKVWDITDDNEQVISIAHKQIKRIMQIKRSDEIPENTEAKEKARTLVFHLIDKGFIKPAKTTYYIEKATKDYNFVYWKYYYQAKKTGKLESSKIEQFNPDKKMATKTAIPVNDSKRQEKIRKEIKETKERLSRIGIPESKLKGVRSKKKLKDMEKKFMEGTINPLVKKSNKAAKANVLSYPSPRSKKAVKKVAKPAKKVAAKKTTYIDEYPEPQERDKVETLLRLAKALRRVDRLIFIEALYNTPLPTE